MTEQPASSGHEKNDHFVGGVILIVIGLVALTLQVGDYFGIGNIVLPVVGLALLGWGILARHAGPMIPGGIFTGIGVGAMLTNGFANMGDEKTGGLFLIGFAGGWVLITILSALFTDETHWWPLIPGGILAFVGLAISLGGAALNLLQLLGNIWPAGLIVLGLIVIWRQYKKTA
jgi:hypothetical protein